MAEQLEESSDLQFHEGIFGCDYKKDAFRGFGGYVWCLDQGLLAAQMLQRTIHHEDVDGMDAEHFQMTLEKEIKEDIAAKMCTLKRQAEEVEICTDTLLQKIKKLLGLSQNLFPERRFVSGFFRRLLAYVTPCIISISIMPHISIQHVSCQYVSIQLYPTRIPPISIPSICIHSVRIRSKGMHQQEWQCM